MQQAQSLLQMGLHPSEILIGYEKAFKYANEEYDKATCYTLNDITDNEEVLKCMKSSVASKQYGLEETLGKLITQACLYSIPKGKTSFSTDNIRVQKILGGGFEDSEVIRGMVCIR